MYPTGGAGDLDVTIKEADGSEQHFTLPYASLPVLQREGRLKYAITGGQYRPITAAWIRPFRASHRNLWSAARHYPLWRPARVKQIPVACFWRGQKYGALGAISADVTQGWSTPDKTENHRANPGERVTAKNFAETGTNFSIAGYRYSTSGYYGMQEVLDSYGDSSALQDRRRNRAELTMSQTLSRELGSLYPQRGAGRLLEFCQVDGFLERWI